MAKQLLLGYTVLDAAYQNGRFMEVLGENPGTSGNLSDIDNPKNAGISLGATTSDPVIFSYAWNPSTVRVLLGKITTNAGTVPSMSCAYSLLESPDQTAAVGTWKALGTDVELLYGDTKVATNPHGVAHIGNTLYIGDYDAQKIYLLGADALNGQTGGSYPLGKAPYDLSQGTDADLPPNAKGQAIIALADEDKNTYLFVLYIVANDSATEHQEGILVKLSVDPDNGSLSYVDRVEVGKNPQEIIPVTNGDKDVYLLVPGIGGSQGSSTNGTESTIVSVPAFASSFTATPLLTGDSASYDIRVIGASAQANNNSLVFILTANFTSDWLGVNWKLYQTTVSKLLGTGGITLSAAVTNQTLSVADQGTTAFSDYSGVYFLDLLYENAVQANGKERLWFFRGSPLVVTVADAYGSPTQTGNAYNFYTVGSESGQLGGKNVNSADLFAETIRQAAAGASLKRGVRATKAPAAARAAAPAEEEEK
ncbi:MAG: hypothetical protein LBD93_11710 [Treponema sp.]|jgi:hypothetical protein|nr:hypothetical protein [Treponema sp.]